MLWTFYRNNFRATHNIFRDDSTMKEAATAILFAITVVRLFRSKYYVRKSLLKTSTFFPRPTYTERGVLLEKKVQFPDGHSAFLETCMIGQKKKNCNQWLKKETMQWKGICNCEHQWITQKVFFKPLHILNQRKCWCYLFTRQWRSVLMYINQRCYLFTRQWRSIWINQWPNIEKKIQENSSWHWAPHEN